MAVDTQSKRSSVLGFALPIRVYPAPDGGLSATGDRQHLAFSYSGIEAGEAAAAARNRKRISIGLGL